MAAAHSASRWVPSGFALPCWCTHHRLSQRATERILWSCRPLRSQLSFYVLCWLLLMPQCVNALSSQMGGLSAEFHATGNLETLPPAGPRIMWWALASRAPAMSWPCMAAAMFGGMRLQHCLPSLTPRGALERRGTDGQQWAPEQELWGGTALRGLKISIPEGSLSLKVPHCPPAAKSRQNTQARASRQGGANS